MSADQTIREILEKYDERPGDGVTWKVQSATVITHKALERIAAKAKISFDPPQVLRAERDEAVILVSGSIALPPNLGAAVPKEWSIGEALVNVNYRVSGKQAAYVYAMAEKRGKDRVILKLIELHGLVYSEEEADEFRGGRLAEVQAVTEDFEAQPFDEVTEAEADLKRAIDAAETVNAVTDLMLAGQTQATLAGMPQGTRDEVRDYAKARLVALGWPSGKGRRRAA